ncbi:MAG: sugar ABC transporter permease [Chloroflexi bacterium]|nr:sugar ABC transporter permease [Chloroflexota bacterium]
MARTRYLWAAAFLALPLAVYIFFVILPLLSSFYYSLTDWNGFDVDYNYVGLENFQKMFTDRLFRNAIGNTVIWMALAIVVPTGAGLTLALTLHGRGRLSNFYKSLFYLPISLALAVIGQIWIWIYQPDWGLINTLLRAIGLDHLAVAWLARPQFALICVIIAWAWQQTALAMVIFLAGLTSIPTELIEAAEIDGANYGQRVRSVIIPLLAPASIVVIALAVINSLKSFDVLYVMTRGGPFHSSDNLAMLMYNQSFQSYYIGYGSAIAVVLFLITLVIIIFYFRQTAKVEQLYD